MGFFKTQADYAELQKRFEAVCKDRDDAWESASNCHQQIGQYKNETERMKKAYNEEELAYIAEVTAKRVEDLFVSYHGQGGAAGRLKAVQAILREVMRANLTGSTNWKGPGEPNYWRKEHP